MHDLADLHARNARSHRLQRIDAEPQASPAHQVLGVQHPDNVFGAALRVVNGNSRMLIFNNFAESVIKRHVTRKGKDIRACNHNLAHSNVVQFQCVVDHLLLSGGNLPKLPAGSNDKFEFIRRVDGALPQLPRAKQAQHAACCSAHQENHRAGQGQEHVHRRSYR